MNLSQKLVLKRMGVMNITPNSFSDGGNSKKISDFDAFDIIDVGAESTAPMNASIDFKEEWERLEAVLPGLLSLSRLSLDTYHPETIFKFAKRFKGELIWNDVSGKFDSDVENFLKLDQRYQYVYCHNLAPLREQSGQHMNYFSEYEGEAFLEELARFFLPYKREQIIFDPCLGFSKTYEQNWCVLENFSRLQKMVDHTKWLIGFSRKSFLRKKFNLELNDLNSLDQKHEEILDSLIPHMTGEVWVRSH